MNINYKRYILFVFLFIGLVSCATDSKDLETDGFRWKIPFDGSDSVPVIHDGIIYIGSFKGGVYAINPKTGKQIWKYQTGKDSPRDNAIYTSGKSFEEMLGVALDASLKKNKGRREIKATPVIEDGIVYVGSRDHRFYALDAKSGKLIWVTDIGHQVFEKAIVTEQHIIVHGYIVGPGDEALFVLDRKNGKIKWTTQGTGSVTPPVFNKNIIFYKNEPKNDDERDLAFTVNAAEVDTGNLLWSITLKGHRPSSPVISQNTMFVTTFEGWDRVPHLYAVDIKNGSVVWGFKAGNRAFLVSQPPTVGGSSLYYLTEVGLFSINKYSGEQGWFLEGDFSQYNITLNKLLYVNGGSAKKNNKFYAIDPKTGKVIWKYADKNMFFIKASGNTVYLSAKEGIVALNAFTGKKLWKFKTGGFFKSGTSVSATPLVFENHVIFPTGTNTFYGKASVQGHLYSINTRAGTAK